MAGCDDGAREVRRAELAKSRDHHLRTGLSDQLVDGADYIRHASWLRAQASGDPIGTCRCRGCAGRMRAVEVRELSNFSRWYMAECDTCHTEVVAPGGRVLRRSAAHREMNDGAWEARIDRLNRMRRPSGGQAS